MTQMMFSLKVLLKLLTPERERAEKKKVFFWWDEKKKNLLFLIVCENGVLVFKQSVT